MPNNFYKHILDEVLDLVRTTPGASTYKITELHALDGNAKRTKNRLMYLQQLGLVRMETAKRNGQTARLWYPA